jgi:hypothetical protein
VAHPARPRKGGHVQGREQYRVSGGSAGRKWHSEHSRLDSIRWVSWDRIASQSHLYISGATFTASTRANTDANTNPNTDANTNPNTDANTNPNTDANTNPNTDANTYPDTGSVESESCAGRAVLNPGAGQSTEL